uniref:Translocator protein n=1 Tax=Aotus nancymaae TaxID=37293 RepID=A0A2K5D1I5_AOTNA
MAPPWVPAVGFTLAPSLGCFVGSHFVHGEGLRWYGTLQTPSWHPPHWMLGPVWAGVGCGTRTWVDVVPHASLSFLPQSLQALVDLLLVSGAAAATTVSWYRVSPLAARLLYPYLAWLAFATTLNYCIWRDNRGRRGGRRLPE